MSPPPLICTFSTSSVPSKFAVAPSSRMLPPAAIEPLPTLTSPFGPMLFTCTLVPARTAVLDALIRLSAPRVTSDTCPAAAVRVALLISTLFRLNARSSRMSPL